MAEINRLREEAIQRVMREIGRSREDAEHFVDFIEGRVLDLDDAPPFDLEAARRKIAEDKRRG